MKILAMAVGEIQANCYLVWDETSNRAVCVDPGAEPARIVKKAGDLGLTVAAILVTHGHYDHTGALSETAAAWNCPVYMDEADTELYLGQAKMIKAYAGGAIYPGSLPYPAEPIAASESLSFRAHRTPGHSAGCVCLEAVGHKALFTGDTLFKGTIGRTDLPGSNGGEMERSLRTLAGKFGGFDVYPGHGPSTTMDDEIKSNRFLR